MHTIIRTNPVRVALLGLALLAGLSLGVGATRGLAVAAGQLWLNPSSVEVEVGQSTDLLMQLDNVTDVYGIDVALSFDPAVLAVDDADPDTPGVQIAPGTCPAPDFVLINTADNTSGTVEYVVTQLAPTAPCDGGVVATVSLECLQYGTSEISFTFSQIADIDGMNVEHTSQSSAVTCYSLSADFSGSPTSGTAPLDVTFTNLSDGTYDACLWDLGDGDTSTDCVGPTHTYAASGTYTVSLTVTDTGTGESDTITRADYVTVSEPAYVPVDADFEGAPTTGVVPLTVQFTNLSTGDYVTTTWDFGDTGTSSAENPTHTYVAAGSFTVTLTATGPGGTDVEEKVGYIDVRYGVYLPLVLNNH